MQISEKIKSVQKNLSTAGLDGWLLYDFRKNNDLAHKFLEIPNEKLVTRRFFYWIPAKEQPIKIVHRIESSILDHLPGKTIVYSSWKEFENCLAKVLKNSGKVAMEYSPRNAVPYVSKVDAGTVDIIRDCGVEVVSSADLLQEYTSLWTPYQLQTHLAAAEVIEDALNKAWQLIFMRVNQNKAITEVDVQQFLLDAFAKAECLCEDPPICAVNAHAADPHYSPDRKNPIPIKKGDFVLIDLWCKQNKPNAVYADITRVGVVDKTPSKRQHEIFSIVKEARNAAMRLIEKRLDGDLPIRGWEVDQACRDVINRAGYGNYFTHRTGHNIGERDHGDGTNIDNFETRDNRLLLPGTCFSIEPGIYLPGEFGVRLEHNVFLEYNGSSFRMTGMQEEMVCNEFFLA